MDGPNEDRINNKHFWVLVSALAEANERRTVLLAGVQSRLERLFHRLEADQKAGEIRDTSSVIAKDEEQIFQLEAAEKILLGWGPRRVGER